MRCLKTFWLCLAVLGWLVSQAHAQTYVQLEFDGQSAEWRLVNFKDGYIEVAPRGGGASKKVPWGHLSQDSLQRLKPLKNFGVFAEKWLDPDRQAPPAASNQVRVEIKPVDRMERPTQGSLFGTPVTFFFLVMFYLGNIYAGYEIAMFRNRNKYMVAGICAAAPLVGPIVFLALPTHLEPVEEEVNPADEAPPETVVIPPSPEEIAAQEAAAAAAAAGTVDTGPKLPPTVVYTRGQTTFNRRFFETKLAGFLKVVPGEAEKDMVLAVTSMRGAYVATRLARISLNDFTLLIFKGNASEEVTIPFSEISELKVRHKDAE